MGGSAVRSFFIRDTLHEQMLAAASASSLKDGSGMSGLEGVHRRLVFWPRVYLDRRSVSTRSEAIPCLLWSHLDPLLLQVSPSRRPLRCFGTPQETENTTRQEGVTARNGN